MGVAALIARRRGGEAVAVRALEELLFARWRHEVSEEGVVTQVRLHDGALLPDGAGVAVFWRARAVFHPGFLGAAPVDREYASMESFALLLSWLASFGSHVLNRPSPADLVGGAHSALAWRLPGD